MNQRPELVQEILSSARVATAIKLTAQIFTWLSTLIVIRFISPEDYGLNAMLTSPFVLLMLVSTIGLDSALVQTKNLKENTLQSTFGYLLLINGFLFLAYFFGGSMLASYFNEPILESLAKVLAFVFLLVPLRVIPNAILDRQLNFKLRAKLEITAKVIAAIVTLVLAYLGFGVWALVSGVILNNVLLSILLMFYCPWFIPPKLKWTDVAPMISMGSIITLSGAILLLSDGLIVLVAGPVLGAVVLGVFHVSIELAMLPISRAMPIINQTLLPALAKFKEDRDLASFYLLKLLRVTSIIFFPVLTGIACISDSLVLNILGEKWVNSITPLAVLSLGMIFRANALLLKSAAISMGHATLSLKSNLLLLVLMLPATLYLAQYGLMFLIFAWIIAEVIALLFIVYLSKKIFTIGFISLAKCLFPAITASTIMASCVLISKTFLGSPDSIIVLLLSITIGTLSYYLATRYLFQDSLHLTRKTIFGDRLTFFAPAKK